MGTFLTTARPLKVLLADDHPLILAGVRRALDHADGIEVVGEARTQAEAIALVERRRPDIVLLDLAMPGVSGTEHIEAVRERWPEVKIVVLSATENRSSIDAALRAGASAYVVKSVSLSDIAAVVRQVATGAVFHAPSAGPATEPAAGSSGALDLTARERDILHAAARGLTTAQISRELYVSEHTVKFHLTNVYRKLGVANRAAAVRYALEHGI
jgi:DNA-binding NarL/FixJ family response regulator